MKKDDKFSSGSESDDSDNENENYNEKYRSIWS